MNQPPVDFIPVQEEREVAFLERCFERAGVEAEHGALISRLLVNPDLRGVRSHGIRHAPGYCMGFDRYPRRNTSCASTASRASTEVQAACPL